MVRSPSTIMMPAPLASPLAFIVTPSVFVKWLICGAAFVPKSAWPLILLSP